MIKLLFIAGTRPEAIKLCPTVLHCRSDSRFDVKVCVTAQHRHLLDQVLTAFHIRPDYDLDLMLPGQTLSQSTSRIISGLAPVLDAERPDMVIVQGDTTTTFCGALAAFYQRIPVGHVEAGLRTGDLYEPFPEELNRVLTSRIARLHFAPTARAAENLAREGAPADAVSITGNTGIDAVLYIRNELQAGRLHSGAWDQLDPKRKLILVTAHRRESFGPPFERICKALRTLARRNDVQIVYPVHPNPNVQEPVRRRLSGLDRVLLIEPVGYVEFVDLMRQAHILLTDSGGIQEEGPSLGKPILVLRDKTERPEAVEAGVVRLVGSDEDRIVAETERLLDYSEHYASMTPVHNPYGDGRASRRIGDLITSFFGK